MKTKRLLQNTARENITRDELEIAILLLIETVESEHEAIICFVMSHLSYLIYKGYFKKETRRRYLGLLPV